MPDSVAVFVDLCPLLALFVLKSMKIKVYIPKTRERKIFEKPFCPDIFDTYKDQKVHTSETLLEGSIIINEESKEWESLASISNVSGPISQVRKKMNESCAQNWNQ